MSNRDCYASEILRAIYSVIKVLAFYVSHFYQLHASTTRFLAMISGAVYKVDEIIDSQRGQRFG